MSLARVSRNGTSDSKNVRHQLIKLLRGLQSITANKAAFLYSSRPIKSAAGMTMHFTILNHYYEKGGTAPNDTDAVSLFQCYYVAIDVKRRLSNPFHIR